MNYEVLVVITKFFKTPLNRFFLLYATLYINGLGRNGEGGDSESEADDLIEIEVIYPAQPFSLKC
jgi:hypothetical protein